MTDDRIGRPVSGSGSVDPNLAQRVEALVDEAVAQAAKGSYGEAAARAAKALEIDPDHAAARDLLLSYQRLTANDDERRRRRRSIAAAAATIEEMIEDGRLGEASIVIEALTLQYGKEAPVEELRARIAEARGGDFEFAELDAAIAAIQRPATPASGAATPLPRLDAMGTLTAEIEGHLRSGRLEEATGRLDQLQNLPGSEERLDKLRNRIEEARQVADEHRREEEILIATAAIEERIRRGSIDDAATRLAELDARHGASAPIAELRQQIQDARAQMAAAAGGAAAAMATERTAEMMGAGDDPSVTTPLLRRDDEPAQRGPARWLAIAAAVALVAGGGGWWIYRQATASATAASAGDPAAIVSPEGVAVVGAVDAPPPAESDLEPTGDAAAASEPVGGAQVTDPNAATAPPAGRDSVAADPGAGLSAAPPAAAPANGSSVVPPVAPPLDASAASTATDAGQATAPDAGAARSPDAPVEASRGGDDAPPAAPPQAPSDVAPSDAAPSDAAPAGTTDVVVEALPVNEPPPAPAPAEPPPAESTASETAARSAPDAITQRDTPTEVPAGTQRAAANEAPVAASAAPPVERPAGPALLGCGTPDVVCVKALQVPTPAYPAPARNRRLTGNVVVMALVNERGRVIETRVDKGSFEFFNEAAVDATSRAVFQPASRAGVPGRSWVRLTFLFDPG